MDQQQPKKVPLLPPTTTTPKLKKETKTYRFEVKLEDSTDTYYPEVSWRNLVIEAKSKERREKLNAVGRPILDPYASDDEDELKALAARFEKKYNEPSSSQCNKKKKAEDFIDKGAGYDESDSFIDNSDIYDELVPKVLAPRLGGFYINSGPLDYKETNYQYSMEVEEDGSDESKKRKTKQITGGSRRTSQEGKAKRNNKEKSPQIQISNIVSVPIPNGNNEDSNKIKHKEKSNNSTNTTNIFKNKEKKPSHIKNAKKRESKDSTASASSNNDLDKVSKDGQKEIVTLDSTSSSSSSSSSNSDSSSDSSSGSESDDDFQKPKLNEKNTKVQQQQHQSNVNGGVTIISNSNNKLENKPIKLDGITVTEKKNISNNNINSNPLSTFNNSSIDITLNPPPPKKRLKIKNVPPNPNLHPNLLNNNNNNSVININKPATITPTTTISNSSSSPMPNLSKHSVTPNLSSPKLTTITTTASSNISPLNIPYPQTSLASSLMSKDHYISSITNALTMQAFNSVFANALNPSLLNQKLPGMPAMPNLKSVVSTTSISGGLTSTPIYSHPGLSGMGIKKQANNNNNNKSNNNSNKLKQTSSSLMSDLQLLSSASAANIYSNSASDAIQLLSNSNNNNNSSSSMNLPTLKPKPKSKQTSSISITNSNSQLQNLQMQPATLTKLNKITQESILNSSCLSSSSITTTSIISNNNNTSNMKPNNNNNSSSLSLKKHPRPKQRQQQLQHQTDKIKSAVNSVISNSSNAPQIEIKKIRSAHTNSPSPNSLKPSSLFGIGRSVTVTEVKEKPNRSSSPNVNSNNGSPLNMSVNHKLPQSITITPSSSGSLSSYMSMVPMSMSSNTTPPPSRSSPLFQPQQSGSNPARSSPSNKHITPYDVNTILNNTHQRSTQSTPSPSPLTFGNSNLLMKNNSLLLNPLFNYGSLNISNSKDGQNQNQNNQK